MIPGALFTREWFHPYEADEIPDMLAKIGERPTRNPGELSTLSP